VRRLLVLTEVFYPEDFIINSLVEELSGKYKITVITRVPTYPRGKVFKGFSNVFSIRAENGIRVIRYPVFTNYNERKWAKVMNLLWQPMAILLISALIRYDRVFVYQTGSIYSYCLLVNLRWSRAKSIMWSQDLWPEVAYENGLPRVKPLDSFLKIITRTTLNHFTKILVQSEAFQNHYLTTYKVQSLVVYNYSLKEKSSSFVDRHCFTNIVYAGNIGSLQNLDGIVDLFLNLRNSVPEIITSLDIYGDGSLFNVYREKYSKLEGITFLGRVPMDDVRRALESARYAIFSLVDGPIQNTLPSRLQFLYNLNIPIIYVGKGAAEDFLNHLNGGVVFASPHNEYCGDKLLSFEKQVFKTNDVFNKARIIKQIKGLLS
jgi:glycosyltransferase involved in cell wall biosynthesis